MRADAKGRRRARRAIALPPGLRLQRRHATRRKHNTLHSMLVVAVAGKASFKASCWARSFRRVRTTRRRLRSSEGLSKRTGLSFVHLVSGITGP
jgi:hypothetical protein